MTTARLVPSLWRWTIVTTAVVAVSLAYHVFSGPLDATESIVMSGVTIAFAAWLLGPRGALIALGLDMLLNLDLILGTTPIDDVIGPVEIIDGILVTAIGIAVGAVLARKQQRARELATDAVTNVPNRHALVDHLDAQLQTAGKPTAAMLEIVDLQSVNDGFGYRTGDEVLAVVARRLIGSSVGAFVARERGDRFVVAWREQQLDDLGVAQLILSTLAQPIVVGGALLQLRARVSVLRTDVVDSRSASDMLHLLGRAIERAGEEGRIWRSAEPVAADESRRLELMGELGRAIEDGQLRLHYQPLVDLPHRSLRGFEALVRWQHPTRGMISPAEFIPLAERTGLIVPLTEWVMREAARQMREWRELGLDARVSVNVGAKALLPDVDLGALVERLLSVYRIDPAMFAVEVTETDVMRDPKASIAVLRELKSLGVRVDIDDFGTGYSSLSYLGQLPLDVVKIDRSFVGALLSDINTAAIVRAAIDLAHALGLEAIAEGVETEPTLERLASLGCDAAQGYLIARPMPATAVLEWVRSTFGSAPAASMAPMPAAAGAAQGTILLVDDEHRVRIATHRMLAAFGYRVIAAASASEAIQMFSTQATDIDLVLTDMHLTDWRGHDLAARLREQRPQLPIVFMSGDATERRNAGFDNFLVKPFSKHQLIDGVKEALVA